MSASTAIPTATSNETKFSSSRNSYGRTTTLPVKRIAIIVSPVLLSTVQPILPVYIQSLIAPYTPRAVIHSLCHPLGPLILGPISLTRTLPSYLSRLFQCALLAILPTDTAAWAWAFWLVLASARVLTGFILTRSVGWAAPGWFSHWALYEDSEGFGPGLLAVLAIRGLEGATLPSCVLETAQSRYIVSLWGLAGLTGLFCWLEWAPWTYAHTWLGIVLLQLILAARAGFARWRGNRFLVEDEEWEVEVLHSDDRSSSETLPGAYETPTSDSKAPRHMPWAHAPLSLLASLLAVLVPYLLWSVLVPGYPTDVQLPPVPQDVAALMNILVLTYPRPPSTNVSARVLNETIASYIPFLSDSITLSVFTHASDHPAFDRIKDAYTSSESDSVVLNGTAKTPAGRYMTFYQDLDSHPTEVSGHYLHLAEAFRWGHEHQRGEWIMLVEDDFPVCWGALGWDYIAMILEQLERERTADGRIRYGWVGTGGSGLIIHRTLLPMLSYLLHTYSSSPPLAPDTLVTPAPDELIQSCLLGRHTACLPTSSNPHYHPSVMASSDLKGGYYGEAEPQMIITSRLVLDHIGGMTTTTEGKAGNTDKWRCGWRHPYHGADEVDVVVVHY